ncbi:hypothetical protein VTH06DRAFT_8734 [Thermothelomyces fergusii]
MDALGEYVNSSNIRNEEYWKNEALGVALKQHLGVLDRDYGEAMKQVKEELENIAARLSVFASSDGKACKLKETNAALSEPAAGQVNSHKTRERFTFESQDLGNKRNSTVSSAKEIFSQPVNAVSKRERVQLALALLKATLIHHSTPAWPKGCVLEAVNIFKKPGAPVTLSDAIKTLSLQVQVGGSCDDDDIDMENGSVASEEDLRDTYGIQNQVLYRLGVALLSIGLWTTMDWREFATVRRKARALDSLGGTYKKAVERLIWANFDVAAPTDLNNEDLRREIIQNIICPLEKKANRR